VPLIGPLFTSVKAKTTDKTELIIVLTPHVVEHRESEVTQEFFEKLRRIKAKIEG
jgi:type II secretory pathway component GspD/PulD (secretin)